MHARIDLFRQRTNADRDGRGKKRRDEELTAQTHLDRLPSERRARSKQEGKKGKERRESSRIVRAHIP